MRSDPKRSDLDSAATLNEACRELWSEIGLNVPYEALQEIRRIRKSRGARQGTTEIKRELRILLAVRDGIPWETASMLEIDHAISRRDGGDERASNLRLMTQHNNQKKGANSATHSDLYASRITT